MTHNGAPQGNTHGLKWTPGHDEMLRRWFEAGYSASQTAIQINDNFDTQYTRNACIGRSHRIGLANRNQRRPMISKAPDRQHPRYNGGAPRQRPAAPPPDLHCVEVTPRHVALTDLEAGDCRFPFGDGPFTFCGNPALLGRPYCGPHARIAGKQYEK